MIKDNRLDIFEEGICELKYQVKISKINLKEMNEVERG